MARRHVRARTQRRADMATNDGHPAVERAPATSDDEVHRRASRACTSTFGTAATCSRASTFDVRRGEVDRAHRPLGLGQEHASCAASTSSRSRQTGRDHGRRQRSVDCGSHARHGSIVTPCMASAPQVRMWSSRSSTCFPHKARHRERHRGAHPACAEMHKADAVKPGRTSCSTMVGLRRSCQLLPGAALRRTEAARLDRPGPRPRSGCYSSTSPRAPSTPS